MASGHGHGSGHGAPAPKGGAPAWVPKMKKWSVRLILTGLAILLLLFGLSKCNSMNNRLKSGSNTDDQAAIQPSVNRKGVARLSAGSHCPLFSVDGDQCEIQPAGSGWMTAPIGIADNLHFCWQPGDPGLFAKVEYLDANGRSQVYDFGNPPQEQHIMGYRFFPKETVTLFYQLTEKPCSP